MNNLDKIAEDLFSKIRGRFKNLTIGDDSGEVVTEPSSARFFDFTFSVEGKNLGKVSVNLSEDDGVSVVFANDFINNEDQGTQNIWYNFLRELRQFAKKRMLNFDTRDIGKSNLNKRDYNFLANTGDTQMTESKLYGTSRTSYQDVDSARIVIKHKANVNPEIPMSRTQGISSIYIESAEGEKFKYPYRHLNGARAMARHVAEGGKPYDDFGKHITGLSEELSSLKKFKTYMSRSGVMAEGLSGYLDVVVERVDVIKKTVEGLQRPNFYKEAFENFETTVMEDVPEDVRENWIDQLTIRQFNEELADVFPYIYKLVSENTLAEEIGPEQLLGEERDDERIAKELMKAGYDSDNSDEELQNAMIELGYGSYMTRDRDLIGDVLDQLHDMTHGDDDGQPSSYDEYQDLYGGDEDFGGYDEAIESSIEGLMGQFAEDNKKDVLFQIEDEDGDKYEVVKYMGKVVAFDANPEELPGGGMGPYEYDPKTGTIETEHGPKKTRKIGDQTFGEGRDDSPEGDRITTDENPLITTYDDEFSPGKPGISGHMNLKTYMHIMGISEKYQEQLAKAVLDAGRGKQIKIPDAIKADYDAERDEAGLKPRALWIELSQHHDKEKESDAQGEADIVDNEKEQKLPLGEKILQYFDYTTGQFPKGETAVLTMVEKEYGEQYIKPAKQFIEMINNKVAEHMGYKEIEEGRELSDADKKVMQKLTGMIKQKQEEFKDARKGGYDEDARMIAAQLEDFYSIAELIQGKRPMGLDTSVMDLVHDMYDEVGAKFGEDTSDEAPELERIRDLAGL